MKRTVIALLTVILLFGTGLTSFAGDAKEKPVRMAYLQNDIHHLACWVALEKGIYKQVGVDVEIAGVFKAGPEIMSAFAAGSLDMAYVGEAPATTAVANKAAKVVVVAQVNTEGSAIVVAKKESGITSVSDLAGRTVAVPGHSTVQDFLLRKALKKNQVPLEKVNIIVLKPPEMIGALRTDQIDGFIAWEPYPSKAATMGVGRNLATSHDIWPDHPCCVLVTSIDFLQKHPEQVKRVVGAHLRATSFIVHNREEALLIGTKYTGMDKETVDMAMNNVNYTWEISLLGEKEYVSFLKELGYIKLDDTDAFVDGFIHQQILEGLTKDWIKKQFAR